MYRLTLISFFISFIITCCSTSRDRSSTGSEIGVDQQSTVGMQIEQLSMYSSIMNSIEDLDFEKLDEVHERILVFAVQEDATSGEREVVYSSFPVLSKEHDEKGYYGSADVPEMLANLEISSTVVKGGYFIEKYNSGGGKDFTAIFCRKFDAEMLDSEMQRLKLNSNHMNYKLFDPNPNNDIIQLYANLRKSIEEVFTVYTDKMDSSESSNSYARELVITEMSEYDYMNDFQRSTWSVEFDTSIVIQNSADILRNSGLSSAHKTHKGKLYLVQHKRRLGNSSAFYRTYSIFRQQD